MRAFTTVDLNKHIGTVTDAALREPVIITHHKRPRFVMMRVEDYEAMTTTAPADSRSAFTLETMPVEIEDGLLALADQYSGQDDHAPDA